MRVLWVTNLVFPIIAKELKVNESTSGGWLYHFAELLSTMEHMDLGIVSIYNGSKYRILKRDNITYILIPITHRDKILGSKKTSQYMRRIEEDFDPELIHIHGAELPLGLPFIKYFKGIKIVLNIQTLACRLEEEMDGGIPPVQWIRHLSLRECMSLKFHTARKIYARLRTEKEKTYYKSVRYVIGSTPWDKAYIINKYPQVRYFTCQYLFRKEFYQEDKWAFTKTESGSILTGQATSPVKGLHILIRALYYVKKEIKNVKLYIPGPNITAKEYIQNYSYAKYIQSLIHKYCLEDNVIFIGNLQETAMVERMRKSQIVVVPSAIELGSSMLCEAMLLGVPIIAAYRGGMTEKFQHGISGFYYDYKEVFLLAEYIKKLLTDQNLAEMFSANEKSLAHEVHDEEKCCRQFYLTYKKILQ